MSVVDNGAQTMKTDNSVDLNDNKLKEPGADLTWGLYHATARKYINEYRLLERHTFVSQQKYALKIYLCS